MVLSKKGATSSFDRDFIFMIKASVRVPGGGFEDGWVEGGIFKGALSILKSSRAMIAQAQTGVEAGVLAVNRENKFPIDTYFKDPQSAKHYRITNTGQESAAALSLEQIQYQVVWVQALPN